jgi:hypothetical protein
MVIRSVTSSEKAQAGGCRSLVGRVPAEAVVSASSRPLRRDRQPGTREVRHRHLPGLSRSFPWGRRGQAPRGSGGPVAGTASTTSLGSWSPPEQPLAGSAPTHRPPAPATPPRSACTATSRPKDAAPPTAGTGPRSFAASGASPPVRSSRTCSRQPGLAATRRSDHDRTHSSRTTLATALGTSLMIVGQRNSGSRPA